MKNTIQTVIIGFTPLTDIVGKKPRELRDDEYCKKLLQDFNIGEVHFATIDNFKEAIDKFNPFIVITFNTLIADEVTNYKKDTFVYVIDPPSVIFYRKAEITAKQAKQRQTFQEMSNLVKKIKESGEEKKEDIRKVASMTYKDTYDMLIKMLISGQEDLKNKAFELLTNNNVHSNFLWMRAQLICETWDHADGKGKEEFLCLAMDQHIENGLAHKLEDFTDETGQVFHQYQFHYPDTSVANYIRRIPVGEKGQNKYVYEALLNKYETPTGPRMMLEAGQSKVERDKYFKEQGAIIYRVLKDWQAEPNKSKEVLGVVPLIEGTESEPLSDRELYNLKDMLYTFDPTGFKTLFSKEIEKKH